MVQIMNDEKRRDPIEGPDLASDLLKGAQAIGNFIGEARTQTYYMLEKGEIPGAFKLNGKWRLRKSRWRRYIEELEAEAMS